MILQRLRRKRREYARWAFFAMVVHMAVASLPMPAVAAAQPGFDAATATQVCTPDGIRLIDVAGRMQVPGSAEPENAARDCQICKLLQAQIASISGERVSLSAPAPRAEFIPDFRTDPVRDRMPAVRCGLDPPQTL